MSGHFQLTSETTTYTKMMIEPVNSYEREHIAQSLCTGKAEIEGDEIIMCSSPPAAGGVVIGKILSRKGGFHRSGPYTFD